MLGQHRPGITLLDEGVQLAGADLDDRKLRGDEESVQQDQREDGEKAEKDDLPGFPVFGWKDGGWQSGDIPCRHRQNGSDVRHGDLSCSGNGRLPGRKW